MITLRQLNFSEVKNQHFDFYIAASGFEERASYQSKEFVGHVENKIVLAFTSEMDDPNRKLNDMFFNNNNFTSYLIDGEEPDNKVLEKIVDDIMELLERNTNVNVYIDYSSMTRNWYAYFLFAIKNLLTDKKITLTFGYSHGKYVPFDGSNTLNRIVKPLYGYCNLSVPSKPTALIIGIGNEINRIYGLKEYFDAIPYLFYSDISYSSEYALEIETLNKQFIDETKLENIFRYPIHDLIYTNYLLENLCKALLNNFRIIITPCGPKPFALLAMINAIKYENDIEVWRISPGNRISKINREPTELVTVLEVTLTNIN
jgi:hypothetical protein